VKSGQGSIHFRRFTWLILAVLLYLSVFGIRIFNVHENGPKRLSQKFQKQVEKIESELRFNVAILSSTFDSNSKTGYHPKTEYSGTKTEDDFSLFIYRDDSLIYWNTNKVILPDDISKPCKESDFVLHLKNGWYGFHCFKRGAIIFLGGYLIKSEFAFQNEYIESQFSPGFNLPASVSLTDSITANPIYTSGKSYLFSLNFSNYKSGTTTSSILIFIIFFIGTWCLFYFSWHFSEELVWFKNRKSLRLIFFYAFIVLWRILQHYFRFPAELYATDLFSPAWYSSSSFLPSLGDLVLNASILLVMSLMFYKTMFTIPMPWKSDRKRIILSNGVLLIVILFCFQAAGYCVTDLVLNSTLSLNLQNISGLTVESGYGLFIVAALFFSLWLISSKISEILSIVNLEQKWFFLTAAVAAIFYSLVCVIAGWKVNYTITLFYLTYIGTFRYFNGRGQVAFSFQNLMFLLCFYSVFATILLNKSNQKKETYRVNLLAGKLVSSRNPVTEILFEQVERRLYADKSLQEWIRPESGSGNISHDSLASYLQIKYFNDYWKRYQIQVTCCEPQKELRIQPQGYLVNCNAYFHGIISNYGEETLFPGLFFLDYGVGKEYYLAVLSSRPFDADSTPQPIVFIEFNLKNAYPDPGYPGLLMNKSRLDVPALSNFSYGLFQNGRLIRAVGDYGYRMELAKYSQFSAEKASFPEDQMVHFQFHISDTDSLLISRKEDNFWSLATPFSYLFILFSVMGVFIAGAVAFPKKVSVFPSTLRNRLLLSLISILVITMVAIGIVQVVNILQINSKKNADDLRDRAYSVVVEVQHKYSSRAALREVARAELEDFLIKLSNVFFTDINVYNENGYLISSSRPQIFQEGLLSERMNAEAFEKLIVEKNSIFIHGESIGSMQFNSAYLPFYNEQNRLLGYVNLPYFIKQDESKKEISSFLVTFFNIYILVILFGVFVTILISNYITAPLGVLAEKLTHLRLGMNNEKIAWKQKDEIGQLVSDYNRMVDELAGSAEKLARSERETAWREMARQVAHEIKNPLTPMKLSAQYLAKAWLEKAPDWENRLSRFTRTMVEQIDALSKIASDFSNFAQMPAVEYGKTDLEETIRFILTLYQDTTPIRYEFATEVSEPFILADRPLLLRLFTNLLNNAAEAIGDRPDGLVRINIAQEKDQITVRISDNGCGISPERSERIFQPDFTTKSSGMGLGLAIVKGIVDGFGGEISFSSVQDQGTIFIIKFPNYV
jgi:signal transduction histidine kinase